MNAYQETKFILNKYDIRASKKLGQNFLIDDEVINKIVEAANISDEDLVIEIGPGLGTLTAKLLEKAKKVVAIELDDRMIKILTDRFKLYENFELIHEDVLKIDLNSVISSYKSAKIVANLPYYITTPIIMKLLEEKLNLDSITVMVQKEVADRIVAEPGDKKAGAITYAVYYYAMPEKVINVPHTSFIPNPEVESEVIKLNLRDKPPIDLNDDLVFFKLIKASFAERRKTFANAVTNAGICSRETIEKILEKLDIDTRIRGEALTLNQYSDIANELVTMI